MLRKYGAGIFFGLIAIAGASLAEAAEPAGAAQGQKLLSLKNFSNDDAFRSIKLSPGGDYIAATVPVGDQIGLAIVRLSDMQAVSAIKMRQQQQVYSFSWVGPQRVVFSIATSAGALEPPYLTGELMALDVDGSSEYLFGYQGAETIGSHAKVGTKAYAWGFMLDPLPDDPKFALITVDSFDGGGNDGYTNVEKIDVYTGRRQTIAGAPIVGGVDFLSDPNGEVRYVAGGNANASATLTYYREPGKNEWQTLNAGELKNATIHPLQFTPDGKSVFLNSNEGEDRQCLVRHDLDTGKRTKLACNPVADFAGVVMSFDRKEPIGAYFLADRPTLQLLDTVHPDRTRLETLAKSFPGQFVDPVSTSRDGSKVLLKVSSDRNPGDYFLYDTKTNKAAYVISRRDWIDPETMAEMRPISYKARDGQIIHGYLTLPRGVEARNLPLVVNPHGGPIGLADQWEWQADAQMLASRGYAVLQVNYRGSSGYGAQFQNAGKKGWNTVMIDDITDGARWATAEGYADSKRLCIYGGSYGGYAALMSAVREPDIYRCAIGYAGIYDLKLWKRDTDTSESSQGRNYIRDFIGGTNDLAAASPITYLDKLKAAVMIVHGEADRRVPFSQAKALRKALDAKSYPYEWLAKAGEGHGFYQPENRLELYEKMTAFLAKNIGPGATPAVAATGPAAK